MGVHWTNFYFGPMAVNPLFGAQKWVQNGLNCRFNGICGFFFSSMVSKLVPKHQKTFEGLRIHDFKYLSQLSLYNQGENEQIWAQIRGSVEHSSNL